MANENYIGEPFRHDVFVSYSHATRDGERLSQTKAWSQKFIENLRVEIRSSAVFRNFSIFFDEDPRVGRGIDRTKGLTGQIRENLESSAILLSLMTPDYLNSDWCAEEREIWTQHQSGEPLEIDGRLFVSRVMPNAVDANWTIAKENESWPDEFKDEKGHGHVGFRFYRDDDVDPMTKPYCWAGSDEDINAYTGELSRLARALTGRLKDIQDEIAEMNAASARTARPAGEPCSIYLYGREGQKDSWRKAKHQLNSMGHRVLPSAPEPDSHAGTAEAMDHRFTRIELMSEVDGVLILGTAPGLKLDRDIVAIGHSSCNSASDLRGRRVPCALLNEIGRSVGVAREYAIPEIDAREKSWPVRFLELVSTEANGGGASQ